MQGELNIVGTPIGNLDDLSLRAVNTLKNCDMILAEDTRVSSKLLKKLEIEKPMLSFHEHNKAQRIPEIMGKLLEGMNLALVTDAGMPCISDPGQELVKEARESSVKINVIPGPTALTTAIAASGVISRRFAFEGFLPRKAGERDALLNDIRFEKRLIVFYEAPHRLVKTLEAFRDVLGESRKIVLCRELTKIYEEFLYFTVGEALNYYENNEPKGEFVILLEPVEEDKRIQWQDLTIKEHVEFYMNSGMSKKDAMKEVAKDRNLSKRDVYQELI